MRTAIIVIGDLGRSPRMQNHARALASGGVDLIGLAGTPLPMPVGADPNVTVHLLADTAFAGRSRGGIRRFVWLSTLRAATHAARLLVTLVRVPRPGVVLVQSPPAVPTLAAAWVGARLRGARFVIDWHNLAHTVLAVRVGDGHRAVRSVARSERRWARRADAHLTVSRALAEWLQREFGVRAQVVYDRPSEAFHPIEAPEADSLWRRLAAQDVVPAAKVPLVVCPTSWTPDEDFDLLLEAIERADRTLVRASAPCPRLAVVLTGQGDLRAAFEARVARRHFRAVAVRTAWLEPRDYPVLVAMADMGLCLHQSSSGLDLPMKLADFRGAGVPACAFDYAPVLEEVITVGHEGVTFRDPGQLSHLLTALADGSLTPGHPLSQARAWLRANPPERWADHWRATAHAVLNP